MDGRPDRRNIAAFSNFSGVVWIWALDRFHSHAIKKLI